MLIAAYASNIPDAVCIMVSYTFILSYKLTIEPKKYAKNIKIKYDNSNLFEILILNFLNILGINKTGNIVIDIKNLTNISFFKLYRANI
jgi:hypothetical protein